MRISGCDINNATWKVIKDAFKHVCLISIVTYYTQVLKQQMKPTQAHGIYLTKDQHFLGMFNWLVKNPEAWDWLCGWWASEDFRVVSKWNQLSMPSVHYYSADGHINKTQMMVQYS
jgi:hypothetical protein